MTIQHIIFYGTLQHDGQTAVHEDIKRKLKYVERCVFKGELYDLGRYPGLKRGDTVIHGELYKILDTSILSILDNYEATDNENEELPGFSRALADGIAAWVYYYDGPVTEDTRITSGVWSRV